MTGVAPFIAEFCAAMTLGSTAVTGASVAEGTEFDAAAGIGPDGGVAGEEASPTSADGGASTGTEAGEVKGEGESEGSGAVAGRVASTSGLAGSSGRAFSMANRDVTLRMISTYVVF